MGADLTGCQVLIILQAGNVVDIVQNPAVTPYDGSDDTLVGVYNESGATITTLNLSSTTNDIFKFDGDGICGLDRFGHSFNWYSTTGLNGGGFFPSTGFSGCSYGPTGHATGYEGPWVSFSAIAPNFESGTVTFTLPGGGGLPSDGMADSTTFFSLESDLNGANFTAPTTTTTGATTSSTGATTSTTGATTTSTEATTTTGPEPTLPPPPPPPGGTTTTAPAATTTTAPAATTTTAPAATTTTAPTVPPATVPNLPPTTAASVPPATLPSGAPGTGAGGAATSSDNGVLLTASGMALFAGLAGLVLIARRRRQA